MSGAMQMTAAVSIMITEGLAETAVEIGATGTGTGKIIIGPSMPAMAVHRLVSIWAQSVLFISLTGILPVLYLLERVVPVLFRLAGILL